MDMKQVLPLLLKGRLSEKEQALLKLTEERDPAAIGALLSQMYDGKASDADIYSTFKKLIPAQTLGKIIKYFDAQQGSH